MGTLAITNTDASSSTKIVFIYKDGTNRSVDVVLPAASSIYKWSAAMEDVGRFVSTLDQKPVESVVYIQGTFTQIYSASDAEEIFGL